jgi:hypothetical protein
MGCCNNKETFSFREALKSSSGVASSAVKAFTLKDYNPLASKEITSKRLEICKSCEFHALLLKKSRCTICGCFLKAKASLIDQSCPHPEGSKWKEIV